MKLKLVILAFCILTSCKSSKDITQEFTPTFQLSKKTTHKIPKGQDYVFGYLTVLENRTSNSKKTIQLPVYIFKSRNPNPKKDPIIYTVGGPGSSSMPSAPYMKYYKYLDDRDFILVEQRGNYYAKPHLDCPEWAKATNKIHLEKLNSKEANKIYTKAAKVCRDRLVQKNIDLNSYNTNEIAADINDLVKTLQIKKYNLLTISYSTKIAQVLMRDYPERIRSVVMDSALPLEVNYDEESVANLFYTVNKLLDDCEQNTNCNKAFPNIKKRFFDYLIEKTNNPLVVQVKNPEKDVMETFYLKGKDLINVFSGASTGDVENIPFEINKLLKNDLTSVKKQLSYLFAKPGNGSGKGMRLSVWCAEEYPFVSQLKVKKETNKYEAVKGLSPVVFTSEVCNIWGVKKVSDIENKPITSNIPVLLINGEYDENTPTKWATSMHQNLKNSFQLDFKGWKHTPTTNWSNQCAMQAANDYFNNPMVKPNPKCFKEIKNPDFKTE